MRSNEFHGKGSIRYNGSERICSRLGDQTFSLDCSASLTPQTQQRLGIRIMQVDQRARAELLEVVEAGDIPIETPSVALTTLQAINPNSSPNPNPNSNPNPNPNAHSNPGINPGIFYYHTNHLGSTAFVTDGNATVTQGFLYAPFGEITTEYAPLWQNGLILNYTFNAKELDEETGMYYYEARYMAPPTFISRDPMFEKYFWMSPYAYCANNPMKYVDPSGCEMTLPYPNSPLLWTSIATVAKLSSSAKVKTAIYAIQHPINAVKVGTAVDGRTNFSSIAHNFAYNIQRRADLTGGGEGDQRNAIRHTLWQAILTKELGAGQAQRIGNSHEGKTDINPSQRVFSSSTEADCAVDLLNNVIGRNIGRENSGADNKTLAIKTIDEFYKNGLWTVNGDEVNGYTIQRTKLTKAQYDAAVKEINRKNNFGLDQ